MSSNLINVRGIGSATVENLKANNIKSVEDLAQSAVADIVEIPGFKENRAGQVIASAKSIVAAQADSETASPVDIPAAKEPAKKPKEPKKKAAKKPKAEKKSKGKTKKGKAKNKAKSKKTKSTKKAKGKKADRKKAKVKKNKK